MLFWSCEYIFLNCTFALSLFQLSTAGSAIVLHAKLSSALSVASACPPRK
jgi:hypothetical protein